VTGVNEQYAAIRINDGVSIGGTTYTPHIHTRAARTKAGWVGQVWLDDEIVWESEPTVDVVAQPLRPRTEGEAYTVARERVRVKLAGLLA
jgi:hypothetical protein